MNVQDRIEAFVFLGEEIKAYLKGEKSSFAAKIDSAIQQTRSENNWFSEETIKSALGGIVVLLEKENLKEWISQYRLTTSSKRVVGILAGNIPMVGFHDMLCVLISGHIFIGKLSSKDKFLVPVLAEILISKEPDFEKCICFVENLKALDYDAVIATGSNNSARYFEYYFKSKPHIIRKGRSSVAIISGSETEEQLRGLVDDVFMYFGLGCRNVSKIYLPKNFDIRCLFPYFEKYAYYKNYHKWMNNYDYNRSIYLINNQNFYDTGFAVFKEDEQILSPISVVFYQKYDCLDEIKTEMLAIREQLQCIVADEKSEYFVPFGEAQFPQVDEYADGIDTLAFLQNI